MNAIVAEREAASTELSPAQRQRQRLDQFMGAIEKRQDQIGTLLADSGIDPRLFLETCRRSLMRDPELINCDPGSFIQAALNCAADGLVPDGRKAAIVRFKGAAQYMPMYQGLLDVAYRTGLFLSIAAHPVYEGDEFDYDMGDTPFIRHKRPLESTSTKIIGAYAIAKAVNGGVFREVMSAADLAKVRAVSRATKGPNVDWPGEMARKAPVRRMWKFLPKTPAMDRVAIHDDASYEPSASDGPHGHGRVLRPGFNPPAISHQATEDATPMDPAPLDEILDGDFVPTGDAEDGLPIRDDTQSEAAREPEEPNKPSGGGDDPDMFPGDRTATAFAAADELDPLTWAAEQNRLLEAAATVADLDALTKAPDAGANFAALKDHSPGIARTLDAAITGRRKALADRERSA